MSSQYSFDNSYDQALQRLKLLEHFHDKNTKELLSQVLGGRKNIHAWEIGGGGGSIARWILGKLSEQDKLVVSDLNTTHLDSLSGHQVTVLQQDVAQEVPPGSFDIIHARAVLCHIATRKALLNQLVNKLKPGAAMLLEEPDFHSYEVLPHVDPLQQRLYNKVIQAIVTYQEGQGMVYRFGSELFGLLKLQPLKFLDTKAEYRYVSGAEDESLFFQLTYQQISAKVIDSGLVNSVEYDNFLNLFADPDFAFSSHSMCSYLVLRE